MVNRSARAHVRQVRCRLVLDPLGKSTRMTSLRKAIVVFLLLAGSVIMPVAAIASSACVNSAGTLQAALAKWSAMSSGDMTIKIVQGTYALTLNGFTQASGNATLSLLGGWNAGCSSRTLNPVNTVIDGQNSANVMLQIYTQNDVTIEGISFVGLRKSFALYFNDFMNGSGYTFTVRFNIFRDFQVDDAQPSVDAGIYIHGAPDSGGLDVYFENNLIYDIVQTGGTDPALLIDSREDGFLAIGSNTITNNSTPTSVNFYNPGAGGGFLENNIIYNGAGATALDVSFGDVGPLANYNIIGPMLGAFIHPGIANLNVDPLFIDANTHDYHLATNSPAVNSGGSAALIPGGYPSQDLDAKARVVGSAIDRGAYESAVDDLNNFTVNTSNDNGSNTNPTVGSLRWAIKNANAFAGASKISFSLSCPTLMNISTVLPDITTDVTIDGYTNPGATPNSTLIGFDANLCVYLNGAGSAGHGLRTSGSGRLTVRGLGFAGFTDAALRLEGGSGHYVTGDQFGDIAFTIANHDCIRVTGSSANVRIGGSGDPAAVNLISGCSDAGIYLDNASGGSNVASNLIGLGTDGSTAIANGIGIYIYNSANNLLHFNYIDNSTSYGVEIAGLTVISNTVIQYNTIGVGPSGAAAGNAGGGIFLLGSDAANNTIGAPANGTYGGNTIALNGGPGVWVSPSAGAGNRVLSNTLYANAGLAIDLGAAGPTPNDLFDGDAGANNLQNYPILVNAFRTNQGEVVQGVLDSFDDNGAGFRLDFYAYPTCPALGSPARGDAGQYLGTATVYADINGHAAYWAALPSPSLPTLGYVSATATASNGSTSEIGECKPESRDLIFRSTFEGGGF